MFSQITETVKSEAVYYICNCGGKKPDQSYKNIDVCPNCTEKMVTAEEFVNNRNSLLIAKSMKAKENKGDKK